MSRATELLEKLGGMDEANQTYSFKSKESAIAFRKECIQFLRDNQDPGFAQYNEGTYGGDHQVQVKTANAKLTDLDKLYNSKYKNK